MNVISKRCGHRGCNKQPTYGMEGTKKTERCSQHTRQGMVQVRVKKCGHQGCTKQPSYGVEGTRKAEFCSEHAREGMVDARDRRRPPRV